MQDTFGRLIGVCENRSAPWSGSCASGQETYYAYDEGERLTTVCQNWTGSSCGQQRLFTYDNRGLFLSERHPEVGPFGNGWTHYSHDALGNVLTKNIPGASGFDLAYRYDRAARLVGLDEVLTPSSSRPLKEFYFARSNSGTNRKASKLVLAKRYNYVDLLPPLPPRSTSGSIPIVISDAYEYRGRDGRTSKHQLRYQLGVTSYLFNTSYTWDEQGNVDRLTYPECLHDACSGRAPPRVIDHDYERGFLRRVGSYADAIAYQAGGMLRRVPHGHGVSDWIDLASDGLARPYRMRTTGVANGNWDTGFYVYDGAQNVSNIGALSFSYDLLSRLTVGDVDVGSAIPRKTTSRCRAHTSRRLAAMYRATFELFDHQVLLFSEKHPDQRDLPVDPGASAADERIDAVDTDLQVGFGLCRRSETTAGQEGVGERRVECSLQHATEPHCGNRRAADDAEAPSVTFPCREFLHGRPDFVDRHRTSPPAAGNRCR